jgi:hypothetical protein
MKRSSFAKSAELFARHPRLVYETTGQRLASFRFVSSSGVSRGCDDFGVSFVPEKGQDYEVAVNSHLRALPRSATDKAVSC